MNIGRLDIDKKKTISWIVLTVLLILFSLAAGNIEKTPLVNTKGNSYERAKVVKILRDNVAEDGQRYGSQTVQVKIQTGELKGKTETATSPSSMLYGADCKVGMNVIVILNVAEGSKVVTVYAQNRQVAIYSFLALFAIIVCAIGGWKGAKALLGLVYTFVAIFCVMFPMVYRGYSPIFVAILVSMFSTLVTLVLLGGLTRKTVTAVLGTTAGVAIAALAAKLFGFSAGITGYNVSNIDQLLYVAAGTKVQIGELLFAGIIISSLGAVMDVGMSISSTIEEIHIANPAYGRADLFRSGINVGKDMMGTMINTLVLAYAGGSLSTLIMNYAYDLSYNQLMNGYIIGIEIMQGLSGSMGVVLTVPITAALSAFLISRKAKTAGESGQTEMDSVEE
ncbi:MAG: YibE/F family protein [Eubacteriales bacterium]|nr:YibE/F family protein [Eubacteriales bacterium]